MVWIAVYLAAAVATAVTLVAPDLDHKNPDFSATLVGAFYGFIAAWGVLAIRPAMRRWDKTRKGRIE